jgi:hypothetical protein
MTTGNSVEGVGAGGLDSEQTEWLRAHEALSRLAKERARADAEEGRWLLAALRSATHVHLGFGNFAEYIERTLGYKPRSTQEKLRVAEALEQLPLIAGALEQGSLHWSCARELTRVAIPETEEEWLDASRGKTVHQLEALVTGKGPGDNPSSPSRVSERRHVLRFEVAPETLALFREAMHALRRSSGQPLDDDSALLLMARQVLVGPRDEGRASYQVALTVCPEWFHRTRGGQPPAKRPHGRPGEADRHSGNAQDGAPSRPPPLHGSRLQKCRFRGRSPPRAPLRERPERS